MEALWKLEDKCKFTTQEAILLFVCTAFAVIGLCTASVLKKKSRRNQLVDEEQDAGAPKLMRTTWSEAESGWGSIKRVLMDSVRWSGVNGKWEENNRGSPLLASKCKVEVGWSSHNSVSPVWQRPILMGEKCELPRFSGLILYDDKGQPLRNSREGTITPQEQKITIVKTTLKDLL